MLKRFEVGWKAKHWICLYWHYQCIYVQTNWSHNQDSSELNTDNFPQHFSLPTPWLCLCSLPCDTTAGERAGLAATQRSHDSLSSAPEVLVCQDWAVAGMQMHLLCLCAHRTHRPPNHAPASQEKATHCASVGGVHSLEQRKKQSLNRISNVLGKLYTGENKQPEWRDNKTHGQGKVKETEWLKWTTLWWRE